VILIDALKDAELEAGRCGIVLCCDLRDNAARSW
jgi:hypothetical protein